MSLEHKHTRTSSVGSAHFVAANTPSAVTEAASKQPVAQTSSIQSERIVQDGPIVGHPREQLEVEETAGNIEENPVYPTGTKLWLTFAALCITMFLNGLDLTIVAVAIPGLTDHFKTITDIGWYSAAYGMVAAACIFFFGKCYTVFRTKHVYLFGLVTFEIGSLVCTLAPTSKAFVAGRAIAGLGASAFSGGMIKLLKDMFPLSRQAMMIGIVGGAQCIGLISAPMIGGLLIDRFTWRACFGINLPLGVMCIAFTAWAFQEPNVNIDTGLPLKEKLKRLDLGSTLLVVPAITCLLMALQWGGIKYGWGDARIIVMLVMFGVLFSAFAYMQYRRGDKATIPPRIIKQRSILGAVWFTACCNGIMAMTENYISIYFQGVRGYTPTKSGLLGVPMIVGLTVASLASATGTTIIGYYFPFLYATSILAPIASGLLTTVDLDGSIVKPAALLAFLGLALGLGIQSPMLAVQATLSSKDVSIGSAVVGFGGILGSALWLCVSATMFQSRLEEDIIKHSPSSNYTLIESAGLSEIRNVIGGERLRDVLAGYNEAVVQTLYLPLALCVLTLVGSVAIERKSIKKKQS